MDLLNQIRGSLEEENKKILNHKYIKDAEEGKLNLDKIKAFVINQNYIVQYDKRSLALMLSKSKNEDEFKFFNTILEGDKRAYEELMKLKEELNIKDLNRVNPKALSYTHFLSFIANYKSPGVQSICLIVNLPVWSENCKRLLEAFKRKYNLKNLGFFEIFSKSFKDLEILALNIAEKYLEDKEDMLLCSKLIQAYELLFWDSIYEI